MPRFYKILFLGVAFAAFCFLNFILWIQLSRYEIEEVPQLEIRNKQDRSIYKGQVLKIMLWNISYGELITTPEIAEEYGDKLLEWIKIVSVSDKKYQEFIETQVDWGEASAIALAKEYEDVLLLLDDLKARKLASKLNLKITGALGIIHKAKQIGLIEKVKPLIEKLLLTNFRISEKVIQEILTLNNENASG